MRCLIKHDWAPHKIGWGFICLANPDVFDLAAIAKSNRLLLLTVIPMLLGLAVSTVTSATTFLVGALVSLCGFLVWMSCALDGFPFKDRTCRRCGKIDLTYTRTMEYWSKMLEQRSRLDKTLDEEYRRNVELWRKAQ